MSRLARFAIIVAVAPLLATGDALTEFYEAYTELLDYARHEL